MGKLLYTLFGINVFVMLVFLATRGKSWMTSKASAVVRTRLCGVSTRIEKAVKKEIDEISDIVVSEKKASRKPVSKDPPRYYDAKLLPPIMNAHSSSVLPAASFAVFGEPLALARHRSSRGGGMYNPSAKFQKNFLNMAKPFLPKDPFQGPVAANITFIFSRPKSHYRTGKNAHILKENAPLYHEAKSDLDNLVKFVLDALNEVAYSDDSQVCSLTCTKRYTLGPEDPARVEVHLQALTLSKSISADTPDKAESNA